MSANPRQMWAAVLAKLVAPMDAERAGKAIAGMLPMLSGYPDEAFTVQAAQLVCSEGRVLPDGSFAPMNRVPTFGEIDVVMGRHWRKQREMAALKSVPVAREALPPPAPPPRDEAAQEAVRTTVAAFMAERSWNDQDPVTKPKVQARPLSHGQLIVLYSRLAAEGDRAALVRLGMLRASA